MNKKKRLLSIVLSTALLSSNIPAVHANGMVLESGQYEVQATYTNDGDTVNTSYTIDVWGPANFTGDLPPTVYFAAGQMLSDVMVEATGGWPEVYVYQWWKKPSPNEVDNVSYLIDTTSLEYDGVDYSTIADQLQGFRPIAGAASSVLTLSDIDMSAEGSQYVCTVSNGKYDTPTVSRVATLTLSRPTGVTNIFLPDDEYSQDISGLDLANSTATITTEGGDIDINLDSPYITVTGFDNSTPGVKNVVVTYDDGVHPSVSSSIPITIIAKQLASASIETMPDKTSYKEGMHFDKTGLVVKLNYDNGTYDLLDADDISIPDTELFTGMTEITHTFSYEGSQVHISIPIVVDEATAIGLEIRVPPNKLKYYDDESLSWDGVEVDVAWDNGYSTSADTSVIVFDDLSSITGVRGHHEMKVHRDGLSASVFFDIFTPDRIEPGIINNITVEKGDITNIDWDGSTLDYIYSNGIDEDILNEPLNGVLSGVDFSLNDEQMVTVTQDNLSTQIPVTAVFLPGSTVEIISYPDKILYAKGDNLDMTGLVVKVSNDHNYSEIINISNMTGDLDTSAAGPIHIDVDILDTLSVTVPNILVYDTGGLVDITQDKNNPSSGNLLTFTTYQRDPETIINNLKITDITGVNVPVVNNGDGTYSIIYGQPIKSIEVIYGNRNVLDVSPNGFMSVISPTPTEGDEVTVTLSPNTGYVNAGVNVSPNVTVTDNGDGTYTFTQPGHPVTITPIFRINNAVLPTTNGTASLTPDIQDAGDTVTIDIDPDIGYEVDFIVVTDKDGNSVTVNEDYEFTQPDGPVEVKVTFKKILFNPTITPGFASINVFPVNPSYGDTVKVTAEAVPGYILDDVIIKDANGNRLSNPFTQGLGSVTVEAVTSPIKYPPVINSNAGQTVTLNNNTPIIGDEVIVTVTPNSPIEVLDSEGNEVAVNVNSDGTYSFYQPVGSVTINVSNLPVQTPDVTAFNATVSLSISNPVEGDEVEFLIIPDVGYQVDKVTVNGAEVTDYKFTQGSTPTVIVVTTSQIEYTVTVEGDATMEPQSPHYGDTVTVTVPNGSFITVKTEAGDNIPVNRIDDITYTYTQPDDNTIVSVTSAPTFVPNITVSNATVTYSPQFPQEGDKVTLNIIPDKGYVVNNITVDGKPITGMEYTQGFTIPEIVVSTIRKTYNNVINAPNASVVFSSTTPVYGSLVSMTITPHTGYKVTGVLIADTDGNEQEYIDNGDGSYLFTQPDSALVIMVFCSKMETPSTTTPTPPSYDNDDDDDLTPSNTPIVKPSTGGSINTPTTTPRPGKDVTVTPTPKLGYKLEDVEVKDKNGNPIPVILNSNGTLTYVQPPVGPVTITPIFKPGGGHSNDITQPGAGITTQYPITPDTGDRVVIQVKPEDKNTIDDIVIKDKDGNPIPVRPIGDGKFEYVQPNGPVDIVTETIKGDYVKPVIGTPIGGTIEVSTNTPKPGELITITTTPDIGKDLDDITVTDSKGNKLPIVGMGDGIFAYTQPDGDVHIDVTYMDKPGTHICERKDDCPLNPMTDAPNNSWYHNGVHFAMDNGVMNGTSASTFSPDSITSRAEAVTILWNLDRAPAYVSANQFIDVSDSAYYNVAANWANDTGILKGRTDNTFKPDDAITREQFVTMLYNYVKRFGGDVSKNSDLKGFGDYDKISSGSVEAMAWAHANKVIVGYEDNTLRPDGTATRAEVSTIMDNFCKNVK